MRLSSNGAPECAYSDPSFTKRYAQGTQHNLPLVTPSSLSSNPRVPPLPGPGKHILLETHGQRTCPKVLLSDGSRRDFLKWAEYSPRIRAQSVVHESACALTRLLTAYPLSKQHNAKPKLYLTYLYYHPRDQPRHPSLSILVHHIINQPQAKRFQS